MEFSRFYFGTAYHPERYPHDREKLAADAAVMRELHMNAVRISAGAVRYAASVGGGREWLFGILESLSGNGMTAVIEVPESVPSGGLLSALDCDGRVSFFQVPGLKPARTLQMLRSLKASGLTKPVCVHSSGSDLFRPVRICEEADLISLTHAPEWTRGDMLEQGRYAGFLEDRVCSMKQTPFFLTDVDPVMIQGDMCRKRRRPHMLTLEIIQAAIHGARGCFFSDLRPARTGASRYDGAVIGHDGRTDTPVFSEIEQIGRMLKEMKAMAPARVEARCAVICGDESEHDFAFRLYKAMRVLGVGVDVLGPREDFGKYAFVAAAGMRQAGEDTISRIRSFVSGGGTFLSTWGLATEDGSGICYDGDRPHGLTDVFGLRITAGEELYPDETLPLRTPVDFKGKHTAGRICEEAETADADVVIRFESGFYKDRPALVRKQFGDGFAYYMTADCDDGLLRILCDKIIRSKKGIARVKMVPGISVERLADEAAEYLVFQNFTDVEKRLPLDYNKLDILFGYDPVPECGVLVLRVPREKNKGN